MLRRDDPLDAALLVSWVTVAWSTATGAAAAVVGARSASLALAGLGVTVLIDVGSSLVLIWRFRHERDGGESVERAERIAHLAASGALVVFAAVLAVQSGLVLSRPPLPQSPPTVDASTLAVVLAAASLLALPWLARWKYAAAAGINSPALRADAHITAVSAGIAAVTLGGLAALRLWGWWWADAGAALALAAIAARQGIDGLRQANR